jgi:polyisoprenoid-binding protein YceI
MSTTTATPIAAGAWAIDPIHSTASFAVRHMVVSTFRGGFADVHGSLDLTGDEPALGGRVAVASVEVKDDNLHAHLQSPEFFDAARHPEVTFSSTSVTRGDGDALTAIGELTIKGITREVVATGTWNEVEADISGAPRIGIDLETTIDRTAHGLNWNAPLPKGGFALANDVTLSVHLEFVPEQV